MNEFFNSQMSQSVAPAATQWPLEEQGGFIFLGFFCCVLALVGLALCFWGRVNIGDWFCCLLGRYVWRKFCRCPSRWSKQLKETLRESGDETEDL